MRECAMRVVLLSWNAMSWRRRESAGQCVWHQRTKLNYRGSKQVQPQPDSSMRLSDSPHVVILLYVTHTILAFAVAFSSAARLMLHMISSMS